MGTPKAVAATAASPAEFALAQNHPNPFNAVTTIPFQLAAPAGVELALYNAAGQKIRSLFAGAPERRSLPLPVGWTRRRRSP